MNPIARLRLLINDGWQDILLVAAPFPRLYHNQKKGTFVETTKALGLDKLSGDWKGVAVGDFNDDGTLDLVLTGYRCLSLLKKTLARRLPMLRRPQDFKKTTGATGGRARGLWTWRATAISISCS